MPKIKYSVKIGKSKGGKQAVRANGYRHQQGINLTTDELIEVSQILRECVRTGKVTRSSRSQKVNQFVRRATYLNNTRNVQLTLNRVNRIIVTRNERENKPTEAVRRIYKALLEE